MPEGTTVEPLNVPVRTKLTRTDYEQLQALAEEEDRSIAYVTRRALQDLLDRRAERLGFTRT